MRTLFLLLLLANLAFFTWARYLAQPDAGSDAQPLSRQIDPQKLPIVSPAPARGAAAGARSAPVAAAADCVEWGSFTLTDLPAARKLLDPLALGARLSERQVEETANWWVYIPPQGDRQGAQRKGAELKALGVDDLLRCAGRGQLPVVDIARRLPQRSGGAGAPCGTEGQGRATAPRSGRA